MAITPTDLGRLGVDLCRMNKSTFTFDGGMMRFARHLIGSPEGMAQQLVTLVAKGYRYYFVGRIKADTESEAFDRRLRDYYDADLPKWTRERRRRRGLANARYLRHDDWFIVLVTEGKAERFWQEDKHRARDVRAVPIRFRGYSISFRPGGYQRLSPEERVWRQAMWRAYREARARGEQGIAPPMAARDAKWHVHVRMDDETYAGVKAYFLNIALHRRADFLAGEFATLGFEPYGPVRAQLRNILRAVNEARRTAHYDVLPLSVIRFERRIVKAFVEPRQDTSIVVQARG
jgi:hypothetical protein